MLPPLSAVNKPVPWTLFPVSLLASEDPCREITLCDMTVPEESTENHEEMAPWASQEFKPTPFVLTGSNSMDSIPCRSLG